MSVSSVFNKHVIVFDSLPFTEERDEVLYAVGSLLRLGKVQWEV